MKMTNRQWFQKTKLTYNPVKRKRDKDKTKKDSNSGTSAAAATAAHDHASSPSNLHSEIESDARQKERNELRDARRKEREERRKQFDKLQDKRDGKSSKQKKKEQKISQEERDKRDAQLGCCHRFTLFLVKLIHVIDAIIGLACVIYGVFIFRFTQPAMAAVITFLTFGSLMLSTSIVGTIGFCTSICRRWGLALSAGSAACIAFFYMFVIIALLADPDTCFNYLTANHSVLYLNDASIAMIRMWLPAIYIACACLAVVETCRFFVLRKLRNTLLRYDAAQRSITERSKQQQDSNRTILTAPLLEDDPSWVV